MRLYDLQNLVDGKLGDQNVKINNVGKLCGRNIINGSNKVDAVDQRGDIDIGHCLIVAADQLGDHRIHVAYRHQETERLCGIHVDHQLVVVECQKRGLCSIYVDHVVKIDAAVGIVDDTLYRDRVNDAINGNSGTIGVIDDLLYSVFINNIIKGYTALGIVDVCLYSFLINYSINRNAAVLDGNDRLYSRGVNHFAYIDVLNGNLCERGLVNQFARLVVVVEDLFDRDLAVFDQCGGIHGYDIALAVCYNVRGKCIEILCFKIAFKVVFIDQVLDLCNQLIAASATECFLHLRCGNVHFYDFIGNERTIGDQSLHVVIANDLCKIDLVCFDQIQNRFAVNDLADGDLFVLDQILNLTGTNDLADLDLVALDQSFHLVGINDRAHRDHFVLNDLIHVQEVLERDEIEAGSVDRRLQICNQLVKLCRLCLDRVYERNSVCIGNAGQDQVLCRLTVRLRDDIPLLQERQRVKALVKILNACKHRFQLLQCRAVCKDLLEQSLGVHVAHQGFQTELIQDLLDIKHLEPFVARDDVEQILHRERLAQCCRVDRRTVLQTPQQVGGDPFALQKLRECFCVQGNGNLGGVTRGLGVYVYPGIGKHAHRQYREHREQCQNQSKNFVENLHNKTSLLLEIPPWRAVSFVCHNDA